MTKKSLRSILPIKTFEQILNQDKSFNETAELNNSEKIKTPYRYDVINFILSCLKEDKKYLEIGVRNPDENFNKINCESKYSVDPGIEFKENPVDFKMTSDEFFDQLDRGVILNSNIKFDVIFIDGLHTAPQVHKDIQNALRHISDEGFIVLHDCNPPSEYHAREDHNFLLSPARNSWNGTVWKAFYKMRFINTVSCLCIDTDWGIGIISKRKFSEVLIEDFNPYFEFAIFDNKRKESLNLIDFETFKTLII